MKQRLSVFIAALALAVLPSIASAAPITFLQFNQVDLGNNFVFTNAAGVSTITSDQQVMVTFDPAFCLMVGCGGATPGVYDLSLTATSTNAATTDGDDIFQNFEGTISITDGALNLLTFDFTDLFTGAVDGSSASLAAAQPPDFFNGTSDVFDPAKLGTPRGFSISFSSFVANGGGGLQIVGNSVSGGAAAGTGTFAASPAAPEPVSMLLLGMGFVAAGLRASRARRKQ